MVIDDTGSVEDIHAFIYCKKWRSGQVLPMPHSLTDSQRKDRATQLLIKYKSGALVTQKVSRKIFFGKKCLFVLLGLLGLTTVVVLLTVFLVKSDLVLKLIGSNNDNDNIANFLPQCPSIDTSQLWTSSNTGRKVDIEIF